MTGSDNKLYLRDCKFVAMLQKRTTYLLIKIYISVYKINYIDSILLRESKQDDKIQISHW